MGSYNKDSGHSTGFHPQSCAEWAVFAEPLGFPFFPFFDK